jgi:hypothetical protein
MANMDHTDAVRLGACEKYLLGDLAPSLRAEFEEHYFSCPVCAADLNAGVQFAAASRQIFAESPAPARGETAGSKPSPWLAWLRPAFALPAFAVLLLFIGYQNTMVIPRWKNLAASASSPRLMHPPNLHVGISRGAESVVRAPAGQAADVFLDIPGESSYQSFMFRVEDSSGVTRSELAIPSDEAGKTAVVHLPSNLAAGEYTIVLEGLPGGGAKPVEVTRSPFVVEIPSQIEQH